MLTYDEASFYNREIAAREAALRAALAERGLPDWLETVSYAGHIFRDWHPRNLGARRYAVAAHAMWNDGGHFGFYNGIARLVSYPGKGFRTFREAREAAARINAALPKEARYPMVEEVRVAMLKKERTFVHDARQHEISARRRASSLAEAAAA